MRKILTTIKLLLIGAAGAATACGEVWIENHAAVHWDVINETNQTIILTCPGYDTGMPSKNVLKPENMEIKEFTLQPGERAKICAGMVPRWNTVWFDFYFDRCAEAFGKDASWRIRSTDGALMTDWSLTDTKADFFAESSWTAAHKRSVGLLLIPNHAMKVGGGMRGREGREGRG